MLLFNFVFVFSLKLQQHGFIMKDKNSEAVIQLCQS